MSAIQKLLTEHIDIWTAAETEKKSGRGRRAGNGGGVYGIKKLRELILELAVRGKLVPQDANDEPASELLKRIQAEKTKLVVEGRIKKNKPEPPISEDEKPFFLPKSWEWVYLPDISDYNVGKTPSTKSNAYWTNSGDGFNWVSIADLNHDNIVVETSKQITDKAVAEVFRCDPAPAGTILMSFKLTLGKISMLDIPAFHNEAIISIYPNQNISKEFLFKVLPSRAMDGKTKSAIKGSTLNSESIAALLIPLPPFSEQQRIVAKTDELMALCDQLENQHSNAAEVHEKLVSHLLGTLTQSPNTVSPLCKRGAGGDLDWQRIVAYFDTLFTTEASIDALKQTLLQLAVMGKLVPQDPSDEPASELLKRIQDEKTKLIAEGKIKKDKPLPQLSDQEKPFELPLGWKWVRFCDFATDIATGPFGSMIHQSDYIHGGVPLINPSHMVDNKIIADKKISVSTVMAKTLNAYAIYEGDIVMARRGEVGRIALVKKSENGWLCGTGSFVLRFSSEVYREYLRIFFLCNYARAYLAGESVGTTMVNLNHGILKKMPIGLPPLTEQGSGLNL